MSMSNEEVVVGEVTDEQINEVLDGKTPEYHAVLEVWREVLAPADGPQRTEKITAGFASRIVSQYAEVTFADMPLYQETYYNKLLELREILHEEIATDEDCLKVHSPEEDLEQNSGHYKSLLIDWQVRFVEWENDWDCMATTAAVELAAISEVHKMFFGQQGGLTAFLDSIQFQWTDADRAELQAELEAAKAGDGE